MTEKITKKLYNGEVEITFFPASHRYKLAGEKTYLISSTGATGILDKSRALIPWAVGLTGTHLREYLENSSVDKFTRAELYPVIDEAIKQHTIKKEKAASAGSKVHDFAEMFAKAKINGTKLPKVEEEDDQVLNGISAFVDWYKSHNVEFVESERLVYSKEHGFVGITDLVAIVDGKKYIIDYKTSKYVYNEHKYQLSGYWGAWEEETKEKLDGGLIIKFGKEDGIFEIYEISREEHEKNYPVFLALYTVKKREKELAKW